MGLPKMYQPFVQPQKKEPGPGKKNEFFFSGKVQPKTKIATGHNALESEADRMADRVVLRKATAGPGKNSFHKKVTSSDAHHKEELELENELNSGSAFSGSVKNEMEAGFGADFSNVVIHADARANQLAESIGAKAFTFKNHIFFSEGAYDPYTTHGKWLLAHELTHVLQQRNGTEPLVMKWDFREVNNVVEEKILAPNELVEIFIENFDLPREKGRVKDFYTAHNGQLFSQVDLTNANNKRTFLDKRSDTQFLVKKWKEGTQWDQVRVDQLTGNDKKLYYTIKASLDKTDVKDSGIVYESWANNIDHIVELQLGGSDGKENLQILAKDPNQKSGKDINITVGNIASKFKEIATNKKYRQLKISIVSLQEVGNYPSINGFDFPLEKQVGTFAKSERNTSGKEFRFTAGANKANAFFDEDKLKDKTAGCVIDETVLANKSFARFIPLIRFTKAMGKSADKLQGYFNPQEGRLPIEMPESDARNLLLFKVDETTRDITLPGGKEKIKAIGFYYPYLSKGKITELHFENGDIKGAAKIYPSAKFIKELDVVFSKDEFKIVNNINVKSPLKGVIVTESALELNLYPKLVAQGRIGLRVGGEKKPLMTALLRAGAGTNGFFAEGDAQFFIPGVEEAKGAVSYKKTNGVYSLEANANVKITPKNNKYFKGGDVTVNYKDGKTEASGNINLDIPNTKDTKIGIAYSNHNWILKGKTTLSVPKLKDVQLDVTYDLAKNKLKAGGTTKFKYKTFDGDIKLSYDGERLTGEGTLDVTKGKVTGRINIKLNEKGKFSGQGIVTVNLRKDIEGSATIIIDENEKVTTKGQIKISKPYNVFPEKKLDIKTTPRSFTIPVPFLSIGGVGINLEISIGGGFTAGIGPGELNDIVIEASFNPFESDKNPSFSFAAKFSVNAFAKLYATIRSSIVLDALIVDAKGGIGLTGSAELNANINVPLVTKFADNVFSVESEIKALAALILALNIEGIVEVEGAYGYLGHWEKRWQLKKFMYAPKSARLGISLPIRYSSDREFKMPDIGDIKIIKPEIDAKGMLSDTLGKSGTETKK